MQVLTHRAVRGLREPFCPWATAGRSTTDGTVVFTRTEPFRVKHAPSGMLLSKELVALDINIRREVLGTTPQQLTKLSHAGFASVLADYFSSPAGADVLASVARGAVIKHLSIDALRAVRVPHDLHVTPPKDTLSLADRLEAALRHALAS
jgi:hypothetical protein